MATIGSLAVKLTTQHEEFHRGLDGAKKGLHSFHVEALASVGQLAQAAGDFDGTLLSLTQRIPVVGSLLGLLAGGAGFTAFIGAALTGIVESKRFAEQLGVSVEQLQALRHAAGEVGVAHEKLDTGLEHLTRRMGEAIRNEAQFGEHFNDALVPFARFGISIDQLKTRNPAEIFRQMADAIARMPTQAERAAAAQQVFGRGNQELIRVLQQGGKGLDEFAARAEAMGKNVTDSQAALAVEASLALGKLNDSFKALGAQVAIAVAPALAEGATQLREWITDGVNFRDVVGAAFDRVRDAARGLAIVVDASKVGWLTLKLGVDIAIDRMLKGLEEVLALAHKFKNAIPGGAFIDFEGMHNDLIGVHQEFQRLANEDLRNLENAQRNFGQGAVAVDQAFDRWKNRLAAAAEQMKKAGAAQADLNKNQAQAVGLLERQLSMQKAAFGLQKELATPLEKFAEKFKEINELRQGGFITEQLFGRALQQQVDQLDKAVGLTDAMRKLPEALQVGSSAAVSAFTKFAASGAGQNQQDRLKQLLDVAKQAEAKRAEQQRELIEAVRNQAKLAQAKF